MIKMNDVLEPIITAKLSRNKSILQNQNIIKKPV